MSNRLPYIDNLKGLLIFLVVLGHLNEYMDVSYCNLAVAISNFIYTFHMPLFLFCSGLFVSRAYEKGKWSGQVTSGIVFLILYVAFYLAKYLVDSLCGAMPGFNPLIMNSGSWYLFVLSIFLLLSPVISKLKFGWALTISLLLSAANTAFNADMAFLSSSRLFTYLPWFVLGYFVTGPSLMNAKRDFLQKPRSTRVLIPVLSVGVLVTYLLLLYIVFPDNVVGLIRKLSTGLHAIGDIKWVLGFKGTAMVVALVLCRLLHYLLVAALALCVLALCPANECALTKWGRNSLQVYVSHLLILYVINDLGGFDQLVTPFGLAGALWAVFIPIVAAVPVTALLAISDKPNRWVANLKSKVASAVLNP